MIRQIALRDDLRLRHGPGLVTVLALKSRQRGEREGARSQAAHCSSLTQPSVAHARAELRTGWVIGGERLTRARVDRTHLPAIDTEPLHAHHLRAAASRREVARP